MDRTDVLKYLCTVLNISTDSDLIIMDIADDLTKIHDLALFRSYIKENMLNSKYQYLTGYQKFVGLMNDFQRDSKPKLDAITEQKVFNFSDTLYKKTCDVFDMVNWHIQTGKTLDQFVMEKSFNEKEMAVLNSIGTKQEILNLVKFGKTKLESKIKEVIIGFSLAAKYPQLKHKSKDQLVLDRIKEQKHS